MNRRSSLAALTLVALAATAALAGGGSGTPGAPTTPPPASATGTFSNPVFTSDFPDPFIMRAGNWYYAFSTESAGQNTPVLRSRDLVDWTSLGDALPEKGAWAARGNTWAPEIMKTPTGYAMYYTSPDKATTRMCIGVATSTTPEGPYRDSSDRALVCQVEDGGSIDASPFVDRDGQRYLYWKNDGNCCGRLTYLWVQRLSDDGLTLLGEPKSLIANGDLWEGNLIEGPFMYRRGDKYYLFYSSGAWYSEYYMVGYAYSNSPTGPFKKYANNPILVTEGSVAGPGGQGVIEDANGNPWMYYHAWTTGTIGYDWGGARSLRLDRLTFKDGVPVVHPTTAAQPAPPALPAR